MKAGSTLASIFLAVSVTACGGGGGGGGNSNSLPSSTTGVVDAVAVGAYSGSITGSTKGTAFQMLVLEDGSFWSLYGTPTSTAFYVGGFVQGTGTFSNGALVSSDARDFGFAPALAASVSGSYTATPSISGKVTYSDGTTTTFNGSPIPNSVFAYNTPAQLSAVTGVWPLSLLNGETANINISNTGVIGGTSSGGCNLTGTVAPRPSGKNVYDVSIKFGAAPCILANQTVTGIGVTYALTSGSQQFIVLLTDASRTNGIGGFGVR